MLDVFLEGQDSMNNAEKASADWLEANKKYIPYQSITATYNRCTMCAFQTSAPLYSCKTGNKAECSKHRDVCNYCLFQHIEADSDCSKFGAVASVRRCNACRRPNTVTFIKTKQCINCSVVNAEGEHLHKY